MNVKVCGTSAPPTIILPRLICFAALTLFVCLSSAHAQTLSRSYRCVDDGGQIRTGQGQAPTGCREESTVPVPKDLLTQPVTQREIEQVTDDLRQQLASLAAQKAHCQAQHEAIDEIKDDALDAIDSLSDARSRGRVTRADRRVAKRIEGTAERVHGTVQECVRQTQLATHGVNDILFSPDAIRAEVPKWRARRFRVEQARAIERQRSEARRETEAKEAAERQLAGERAREEQREAAAHAERQKQGAIRRSTDEVGGELLAVLKGAVLAYEMLDGEDGSYEEFSSRLRAVGGHMLSIRVKYASSFERGDNKALAVAVSAAGNALFTVQYDLKEEREAFRNLATQRETLARYRAKPSLTESERVDANKSGPWLRQLEQQYERAKSQLEAKRKPVTLLVAQAVKIAKEDGEMAKRANAKALDPPVR